MPKKPTKKPKSVAKAAEIERHMKAAERVAKEWLADSGIGDYCEVDGSTMLDGVIRVNVVMAVPQIDIELALEKEDATP